MQEETQQQTLADTLNPPQPQQEVPAVSIPTAPQQEAPTAPIPEGTITDSEPRNRYRGQIVVSENDRTVGSQTFRHIRLESGEELDLTNKEYAGEVHVSYPPHA